jgi:hypothetical protein
MASARTFKVGPRTVQAGDGGLLTAAVFALVVWLPSLLWESMGAGIGIAGIVGTALAPLLAWRLHVRHADGTATLGAILGFIAGVVVLFVALALGLPFGLDGTNIPGVVVVGVAVLAAAYLVAIVWLDVDALRDLSPQRRTHVWLDILRLLATAVYVAFIVAVIVRATGASNVDQVQVLVVLVGPGALGAAAVMGADLMVRRGERRSHGRLVPGV